MVFIDSVLLVSVILLSFSIRLGHFYLPESGLIYCLIILLRQEGLGYRKISRKLNQWGIKTHRGKKWFNTSVSSVLKRKHERDVLFDEIRNQHFPSKISKFEVNY